MGTNSNFSASQFTVQQYLHSQGHDIHYRLSLHKAAALQQEWTFTEEFHTQCVKLVTFWEFEMILRRDPNSGVVSGGAILMRNDILNHAMEANFEVKFHNFGICCRYAPEHNAIMLPYDEIHTHIQTIVPDRFSHLLQGEIMVDVRISVRNCHQEESRKRSASPDAEDEGGRKKLHCSKM